MTQIETLMKNLDISEEEAKAVIESDKAVDKMKDSEVNADLSKEQQKVVKKMKNTGQKKVSAYGQTSTREKKTDTDKSEIINSVKTLLESMGASVTVSNAERELNFMLRDRKFKIVLSCPRK